MRCLSIAAIALGTLLGLMPGSAPAEQASQPSSSAAGYMTTGAHHSCAVHLSAVRCWGYGGDGQLGYGNPTSIGDDETPNSVGPVDLGFERVAIAVSAGNVHTCALLDDGTVRCWGFGADGRLGYGNTATIGDDESPGSVGPVDLGPGRTAKAISAGDGHTCALLDNNTVRCWGYGFDGRLGLNSTESIGDNETPGSVGPINFGPGLTVKAISAGNAHTCAILSDDTVRCWGFAGAGRLGYGDANCIPGGQQCPRDVGRGCVQVSPCTPDPAALRTDTVGPVDIGAGRTAKAISAGQNHTCALLDDNTVRCWGSGGSGQLGTANGGANIGDNELPGSVPPVDLGSGRTAKAISAGGDHTCAIRDDDSLLCWGASAFGQLGLSRFDLVGDDETPGSVGPVDLGPGRTAAAASAGFFHTCARLDDESVRCWGWGANGRLGYCSERSIGDDETPGGFGPVNVGLPSGGAACPTPAAAPRPSPARPPAGRVTYPIDPRVSEAARRRVFRSCLSRAARHTRRDLRRMRRLSGARRTRARRHARRHRRILRRRCVRSHGTTPGRVTGVEARPISGRRVILTFKAPGSDGARPPAARTYIVKQSRRPIRSSRAFRRASTLCRGRCSFDISSVGATLRLTVTGLRRNVRYYFAIAARDNVSGRTGPRSRTTRVRTR